MTHSRTLLLILGLAAGLSSAAVIQLRNDGMSQNEPPKNECFKGPSYWCSGMKNARACGATEHCIQTVWGRKVFSEDSNNICRSCTSMVEKARSSLSSNRTKEAVKLVLETSCSLLAVKLIRLECMKIVEDFIPEMMQMLATHMSPQQICSTIGLCNSAWVDQLLAEYADARQDIPSSVVYQCEYCQRAFNRIQEIPDDFVYLQLIQLCSKTGPFAESCNALVKEKFDENFVLLKDGLKDANICKQFHYCNPYDKTKANEIARPFVPTEDAQCEFCEALVTRVRDVLIMNTTESEFKLVLESLCKQMGDFQEQCLEIVDLYAGRIYNFIAKELNANEACRLMTLCPNPGLERSAQKVPLMLFSVSFPSLPDGSQVIDYPITDDEDASLLYDVLETGNDDRGVEDYSLSVVPLGNGQEAGLNTDVTLEEFLQDMQLIEEVAPAKVPDKAGNTTICIMCEYAMTELEKRLSLNSTEEEIRHVVDNLCAYLPSSVADMCITFLEKYGEDVYQLLLQKLVPRTICVQIGLCTAAVPSDLILIPHEDDGTRGVTCDVCQAFMEYIDIELDDDTADDSLEHIAQRACDHVSISSRDMCKSIVENHGPYLLSQLGIMSNAYEACQMAGLCKQGTEQEHFQDADCTRGPSYWCISLDSAKACDALDYCQAAVWSSSEP